AATDTEVEAFAYLLQANDPELTGAASAMRFAPRGEAFRNCYGSVIAWMGYVSGMGLSGLLTWGGASLAQRAPAGPAGVLGKYFFATMALGSGVSTFAYFIQVVGQPWGDMLSKCWTWGVEIVESAFASRSSARSLNAAGNGENARRLDQLLEGVSVP